MAKKPAMEVHPAVVFGKRRGWDYTKTAAALDCEYGAFKQIVRGFRGLSVTRADEWERLSRGELRSIDLLRWHQRNRRGGAVTAGAA
jgi:hypothetical protein